MLSQVRAAQCEIVTYDGAMAYLGPWVGPSAELQPESYYWGAYLVSPNTPLRLNRYSQNRALRGSSTPFAEHSRNRLDCSDIGHRVIVNGPDPNHLDADHDGIGCEDW